MIRLLVALAVVVAAVWLAEYSLHDDVNYVVIGVGPWVVKSSLSVFVVLLLVAFVPAYLLVRLVLALWRSPRSVRAWRRGRKYHDAQEALSDGLIAVAEGRWRDAENLLSHAVKQGANPQLGYIAAAQAAQSLRALERRDEYLRLASRVKSRSSVAVGITQAQLQLEESEREQALATLLQLRADSPRHSHVLELLGELYRDLGDWRGLLELVPALRMQKVVSKREGDALEVEAHLGLLIDAAAAGLADLDRTWEGIPRSMRENVELIGAYVELGLELGRTDAGERLLYGSVNREWDERLVYLYGLVEGAEPRRQLNLAEKWLMSRGDNAMLLLTLGRLCMRNRLWGKARSYLDASIGLQPRGDSYRVLVELLDAIGETADGDHQARKALSLYRPEPMFLPPSAHERLAPRELPAPPAGQQPEMLERGGATPALGHSGAAH